MGNIPILVRDLRCFIEDMNTEQLSPDHSESIYSTPLINAVIHNRVTFLRLLLLRGASVNTKDNDGNTLLHIAIINNSKITFNFLLSRAEIKVDEPNLHNASALFSAVVFHKLKFVKKLVKKGADVNRRDKAGCIPLHYACHFGFLEICHFLIKAGSEINVQNSKGNTPLYQACLHQKNEIIYMLLYYGADATVPSNTGKLPVMIDDLKFELRLTLYNYTFDDGGCTMDLKILTRAMVLKWRVFPKILETATNVTYNEEDLQNFSDRITEVKPEHLKLFWEKFDYVFKDMCRQCCVLTNFLMTTENMKRATPEFLTILYTFLESDFIEEIIESRCVSVSSISSLINIFRKSNFSLEKLTEAVLCLLSYGVPVNAFDLNAAYVSYGRSELFEIMLHMEIEEPQEYVPCCTLYDHEVIQQSIMPYFIYDVNLTIESFLQNPRSYLLMDLDVMLFYFARPQLKEFFLDDGASDKVVKKIEKLPEVPCLVELARDAARSYIIRILGIKNSSQFYTVLKKLPVHNVYKAILSFEKKLYCDL